LKFDADEKKFQDRMVKEAVHELGHTFGLVHCPDPKCVMYFSNCLEDTDFKGKRYCGECKKLLRL
jgi:archaemetzincin